MNKTNGKKNLGFNGTVDSGQKLQEIRNSIDDN